MWVVTNYNNGEMKMFEFETIGEAQEQVKKLDGASFVTEVIYYNDSKFTAVHAA